MTPLYKRLLQEALRKLKQYEQLGDACMVAKMQKNIAVLRSAIPEVEKRYGSGEIPLSLLLAYKR